MNQFVTRGLLPAFSLLLAGIAMAADAPAASAPKSAAAANATPAGAAKPPALGRPCGPATADTEIVHPEVTEPIRTRPAKLLRVSLCGAPSRRLPGSVIHSGERLAVSGEHKDPVVAAATLDH